MKKRYFLQGGEVLHATTRFTTLPHACCHAQAALLITPIIKGGQLSAQPATQAVIITLFLLGCLQLLLLRKHLHTYCRYRHHMTLANRLLRALFSLVPAKLQDYDVMSKWVKPKSQGPGFALGAYCLFSAMAQLQVGLLAVGMVSVLGGALHEYHCALLLLRC